MKRTWFIHNAPTVLAVGVVLKGLTIVAEAEFQIHRFDMGSLRYLGCIMINHTELR